MKKLMVSLVLLCTILKAQNTKTVSEIITLPFTEQLYADLKYALVINDSIYGPVNVSKGWGTGVEYQGNKNPRAKEKNSAWFKFTITKDTVLTFDIVPILKTDDYDFTLFKCDQDCFFGILSGKINPVRQCLSWNTSQNCNTGLSSRAIDTTYEAIDFKGIAQGKTYSPGLRVKKGDSFFLMVNAPVTSHQDPGGFTIYFYNQLPKNKYNTYNK